MADLREGWEAAVNCFNFTKLTMDAMPIDDAGGDVAVDIYCAAMDDLIHTPAPDGDALLTKFRLCRERFGADGFATPAEYSLAFERDVRRLLNCGGPFDAKEWIERATQAGATMFVRGEELWIGMLAKVGRSEAIDALKAELDDEARDAVREVLASRGLVCEEA